MRLWEQPRAPPRCRPCDQVGPFIRRFRPCSGLRLHSPADRLPPSMSPPEPVAWLASLLLPCTLLGCIVADPPPYEPTQRSPPVLDLVRALPFIGETLVVDRITDPNPDEPTFIAFSIPVRSEDDGRPLQYALHLDYTYVSYQSSQTGKRERIPPSTFDDTSREIQFRWDVLGNVSDGCHQLTLVVAHDDNWNLPEDRPWPGVESAMATWWINVNPAPGERYTLKNCPNRDEIGR